MHEFFEIAYAAAANRLVLFTGTGFSKAITGNQAPAWSDLMEELCLELKTGKRLHRELFPTKEDREKHQVPQLGFEEIAQILELYYLREGRNIYDQVTRIIEVLELAGDNEPVRAFLTEVKFQAITTNYDKLLQELVGQKHCQTVSPGLPIPRSDAHATVYHIHGSVDAPHKMVLTSSDYFDFMNTPFYFSKKLDTLLHEATVVIMGYSLGDANLKPILNAYTKMAHSQTSGGNLFFISRNPVGQNLKDFYAHCYGIRVLDRLEINDLFKALSEQLPQAEACYARNKTLVDEVVDSDKCFDESYLRMENAIFEINLGLSAAGKDRQNETITRILADVIETKVGLTKQNNAWEQYNHLAKWLVFLGSSMKLTGTSLEKPFLRAVKHSMKTCSEKFQKGKSYKAYQIWALGWSDLLPNNRELIAKKHSEALKETDAYRLINSL